LRKETVELLTKINERLKDESKQWAEEVVDDWNSLCMITRTPFPLMHEDCFNFENLL
jgi:hypothetical protein